MFYVLIFSLLAVVLIFAFASTVTRRRRTLEYEEEPVTHGGSSTHASGHPSRRNRKMQRAQSRHDRRKRH